MIYKQNLNYNNNKDLPTIKNYNKNNNLNAIIQLK